MILSIKYNDFVDKALPPTTAPRLYVNNQMPDNLYNCEDGELNSICGHYREWGGTPNDPDIKLGAAISIDVATHRQVCAVNWVTLADCGLSRYALQIIAKQIIAK